MFLLKVTCPIKTHCESQDCAAWKRGGSGETLYHLPITKEATRELGKDILQEAVGIEQGAMSSN